MSARLLVCLIFVLSLISASLCSIQCLDASGNPVDWWLMFKLGSSVKGNYGGYTIAYTDVKNPGSFTIGNINDTNALSHTISQLGLYGASVDNSSVGWAIWNDQTHSNLEGSCADHEKDSNGNIYGHTKGTIGFDSSTGFWLAHSAPGFPYGHNISPNYWHFPRAQTIYAQHFFCISISYKDVNKFGDFLEYYHAYIYDSNVPSAVDPGADFRDFIGMHFHRTETSITFNSLGGVQFTAVGKYATTNADMYEDYVASQLKTGLFVQSWCGGTFGDQCEPSYCAGAPVTQPSDPQKGISTYPYDSIGIKTVSFNGLEYTNTYNHAKWALSNTNTPWFCASDNNRQYTQRLRGGGALCMQNAALFGLMKSVITAVNATCPHY